MACTEYVVGFMFSEDREVVVLIEKTHPEFQKGLLNGPGGKVEPGETARAAMVREFLQEAGQVTEEDEWNLYAVLHGVASHNAPFKVYFLRAFRDIKDINRCYSATEEKVTQRLLWELGDYRQYSQYLANTPYLITMAMCMDRDAASVLDITEVYTDER